MWSLNVLPMLVRVPFKDWTSELHKNYTTVVPTDKEILPQPDLIELYKSLEPSLILLGKLGR